MPSNKFFSIIKKDGAKGWNIWRENHPEEIPNLADADLRGMNLEKVNFSGCDLSRANLSRANLHLANLGACYDPGRSGRLSYWLSCWLEEANLADANLTQAVLIAYCDKTIFSRAICDYARFVDVESLQNSKGLKDIIMKVPNSICSIGVDTILKSRGLLPTAFLKKCGYSTSIQKLLIDLEDTLPENKKMAQKRQNFNSVFISCVEEDSAFAQKLQKYFQDLKINNWFYKVHLLAGQRPQDMIDVGIREQDRMILVVSENMFTDKSYRYFKRDGVRKEVLRAREKEGRLRKRSPRDYRVIFPIMLDDAFLNSQNDEIVLLRDDAQAVGFEQKSQRGSFKSDFVKLLDGLDLKKIQKAIGTVKSPRKPKQK